MLSAGADRLRSPRWNDRFGLLAFTFYFGFSVLFFGRLIVTSPHSFFPSGGTDHDPSLYMWCLVWWPYAIAHRLNPFLCRVVWAPSGVNLAWVTSIPGAALLAAPLTRALGSVATYNLLCFLCQGLAGWAAFALFRHLTRRYWASILGGYLFAFSPYMLGRMLGQLVMMLVFPVPLAVLVVLMLAEGRIGRAAFVASMAVVLIGEFSFSLEIFATMTAFGTAALAIAFSVGPEQWRDSIRRTVAPLAASYAIALVLLAPYLYYLFAFGFPHGSIVSPKAYSSDLLNFLVPTPTNLLGTGRFFASISRRFPYRPEACAYVALPLLAIIAAFARSRWKTATGKFLVIMLGAIWLASLGPRLHVAGHVLFGLPWKIATHLPLIRSALPGRFSLYGSLVIALITALWMSDRAASPAIRGAAAALIVVFTLPNLNPRFWTTAVNTPPFFTTGEYPNYLAPGENVLVLPYGLLGNSMLWQAETAMYFRMAGAHTGPIDRDFMRWPVVTALYFRTDIPDEPGQLKAFLAAHNVGAIIVAHTRRGQWWKPLLSTLGVEPIKVGGVHFYKIARAQLAPYRNSRAIDWEIAFNRARFEQLLVAAEQYVSARYNLSDLTPLRAERLGFLPPHWALGPHVYTRNGLWLGTFGNNKISVGVVGSWNEVKPLVEDYRAEASAVYFPYPHRLDRKPRGDTFMRKLVMVFGRKGLERAAEQARSRLAAPSAGQSH
jgi:hypothetical protein